MGQENTFRTAALKRLSEMDRANPDSEVEVTISIRISAAMAIRNIEDDTDLGRLLVEHWEKRAVAVVEAASIRDAEPAAPAAPGP